MLADERHEAHWVRRSVGYVGVSDAWQDLVRHGEMRWTYDFAPDGNVALAGELEQHAGGRPWVLALGFGLRLRPHSASGGIRTPPSSTDVPEPRDRRQRV